MLPLPRETARNRAREAAARIGDEAEPGAFARFASLAARRFADTRKFRDAEAEEVREFLARRPAE